MNNVDYGPLFQDYKVKYGANLEFIGSTLYDSEIFVSGAAGSTSLSFFQTKRTNISAGNLPLAGTLPDPQGFLVMSMRFYPRVLPRSGARAAAGSPNVSGAVGDVVQLINTGVLSLVLLNKKYGQFPLWMLPSGGGVSGGIAAEGATADPGGVVDFATNGVPDARNAYVLQEPLFIPPVTEIGVTLSWPSPLTLAGGDTVLQVLFDGYMVRPVQ
jgi:hypothetical protein